MARTDTPLSDCARGVHAHGGSTARARGSVGYYYGTRGRGRQRAVCRTQHARIHTLARDIFKHNRQVVTLLALCYETGTAGTQFQSKPVVEAFHRDTE